MLALLRTAVGYNQPDDKPSSRITAKPYSYSSVKPMAPRLSRKLRAAAVATNHRRSSVQDMSGKEAQPPKGGVDGQDEPEEAQAQMNLVDDHYEPKLKAPTRPSSAPPSSKAGGRKGVLLI